MAKMRRSFSSFPQKKKRRLCFIDLFAGCGGLALGLQNSGWTAIFAVEQSPQAFRTLRHNLIDKNDHNQDKPRFKWPTWLEISPHGIRNFIKKHRSDLKKLAGHIQLVAGGPPCQGFSYAGKRTGKDPRNELFKLHLEIVDFIKPQVVLLENVQGIDTVFGIKRAGKKRRGRPRKTYAGRIRDALRKHGYEVQQELIRATDFGVPQFRPRYITIGIRRGMLGAQKSPDFFELLRSIRLDFLKSKGLPVRKPVTVSDAISDLEKKRNHITPCVDPESPPGYFEILYRRPTTPYQRLMHAGMNGKSPDSLRLVNHRPETIARYQDILRTCRKGVQLSRNERFRFGIKKAAVAPLSPDKPSHTLTTLPDDLLHYDEPRIHTVREYARLQSFPDWFEFLGKYTTGGDKRARECPRYTQVGNAVPPLLAEALGQALMKLLSLVSDSRSHGTPVSQEADAR